MSPGEFYQKTTSVILLCNGWTTSGTRSIVHNAEVDGVWSSLHQVGLGIDCKLEHKDIFVIGAMRRKRVQGIEKEAPFTYGELFEKMCDRIGLLAIDEGDHYHVQPKQP